jgi:CubicO group peptidase (beta-lactamase class C family)
MNNKIPDRSARAKHYLEEHTAKSDIPGIQYVVVDSQQTIFSFSGGWADIKNKKKMQPTTTMMAYSMTKTFTAAAVLQLVESGSLDLKAPVSLYLPDLVYGNKIMIEHLLSHTSGIPNPIPLRWVHLSSKHQAYDEDVELQRILKENDELSCEPGEKYAYSNIGYWLLGKVIKKVSGHSYEEYIDIHLKNHYLNGPAFGGLIGSAENLSLFLKDQLKKESVLFGTETKSFFYRQQQTKEGKLIEMTLGWHIGELKNGERYFYKEGGGGGYHSEMRIYPEKRIGSIIMVNKTNFNSKNFLNTLDNELLFKGKPILEYY